MGKTSLLKELGRRLELEDWIVLFVDVEAATRAEDAVADIAQAAYKHRPLVSRLMRGMKNWFDQNVEELEAHNFRMKLRANLGDYILNLTNVCAVQNDCAGV